MNILQAVIIILVCGFVGCGIGEETGNPSLGTGIGSAVGVAAAFGYWLMQRNKAA